MRVPNACALPSSSAPAPAPRVVTAGAAAASSASYAPLGTAPSRRSCCIVCVCVCLCVCVCVCHESKRQPPSTQRQPATWLLLQQVLARTLQSVSSARALSHPLAVCRQGFCASCQHACLCSLFASPVRLRLHLGSLFASLCALRPSACAVLWCSRCSRLFDLCPYFCFYSYFSSCGVVFCSCSFSFPCCDFCFFPMPSCLLPPCPCGSIRDPCSCSWPSCCAVVFCSYYCSCSCSCPCSCPCSPCASQARARARVRVRVRVSCHLLAVRVETETCRHLPAAMLPCVGCPRHSCGSWGAALRRHHDCQHGLPRLHRIHHIHRHRWQSQWRSS